MSAKGKVIYEAKSSAHGRYVVEVLSYIDSEQWERYFSTDSVADAVRAADNAVRQAFPDSRVLDTRLARHHGNV